MKNEHGKIDLVATGRKIKDMMDDKEISIRDMSRHLGLTYQAVWKYIYGETLPNVWYFYEIARLLDSSVEDLIIF